MSTTGRQIPQHSFMRSVAADLLSSLSATKHMLQTLFGQPWRLKRMLSSCEDLSSPLEGKYCIAESSVVPWHALGQSVPSDGFSFRWRPRTPGLLTGWGPKGQRGYGPIAVQSDALAQLGTCTITQDWSCDLRQVHGFSASKSDLYAFESTDEMVQANSPEMINEVSARKLAENLGHREIRVLHDPQTSDHFERYAWDARIWLINGGGSHHTAAAKYIATRLDEQVLLTGKLHTNRLNEHSVACLIEEFEIFLLPATAPWANDFSDAMELDKVTWFSMDAPRQLGKSQLIFLPRASQRSMSVARLLRQHHASDFGAHLAQLVQAQAQTDASASMSLSTTQRDLRVTPAGAVS